MLIVTKDAYNRLGVRTKAELLSAVFSEQTSLQAEDANRAENSAIIDWNEVVDLSPGDIEEFIDEATSMYEGTIEGLRLIAEHGPILHHSFLEKRLIQPDGEPWFSDLATFQRSTTRRVRSVTGGKHDYLLGWDDWDQDDGGHYGVTNETHRSLRVYFGLS